MAEFLLELLSEEIPARMQVRAKEGLRSLVCKALDEAELAYGVVESFATPRRLALAINDAATFKAWVMDRAGKFPAQYRRIKAINLGLETVDDVEAEELEAGKNECALG